MLWQAQDRLSHRARPGANQQPPRLPQEKDRPFPCVLSPGSKRKDRGEGKRPGRGSHQAGSPCPDPALQGCEVVYLLRAGLGGRAPGKPAQGGPRPWLSQQGRLFLTCCATSEPKGSCSQPAGGLLQEAGGPASAHPNRAGL